MLWEIEIRSKGRDNEQERVCHEFSLLTHGRFDLPPVTHASRGYILSGAPNQESVQALVEQLLVDSVVEYGAVRPLGSSSANGNSNYATVMPKPGVMDPAALSVDQVARNLNLGLSTVRTFRRYFGAPRMAADAKEILYRKVLA